MQEKEEDKQKTMKMQMQMEKTMIMKKVRDRGLCGELGVCKQESEPGMRR